MFFSKEIGENPIIDNNHMLQYSNSNSGSIKSKNSKLPRELVTEENKDTALDFNTRHVELSKKPTITCIGD